MRKQQIFKELKRFKENNQKFIKIFKKVLDKTARLLYNIQVLKIKKKNKEVIFYAYLYG